MEMGLGKTLVALRYCKYLSTRKVLIVAPLSTFYGWQQEIGIEYSSTAIELLGTPPERSRALNRKSIFYILNKKGIWSIPKILLYNWDMVILDESDFIKAPPKKNKSKRFGTRPNTSRFFCENFK